MKKSGARIIATLGPASCSESMLRKMIACGMDTARLNFSHGTRAEHEKNIRRIRRLNRGRKNRISLLQDLAGYRIRIGHLRKDIPLRPGQEFYITQEDVPGSVQEVSFDYAGSMKGIRKGHLVYIEDGRIVAGITRVERKRIRVRTHIPGVLKSRKGVNIPEAKLEFEALTDKDREDVRVAVDFRLENVAQSFVRSRRDLRRLKELVKPEHPSCRIFAKIENPDALKNLDAIIDESDGIMVARGDMGISVPVYKVPVIQKVIAGKCRKARKPMIVATQMLESMTENMLPTRAEVSDVANAIWDGAAYCMLSGETAIGRHPDRVVDMMAMIIHYTEKADCSTGSRMVCPPSTLLK